MESATSPAPPDIQHLRYEFGRIIGRGAGGLVYEAVDRRTQERVAIKVLRDFTPQAILRLKNEFRGFADISHPNLVALHELIATGEQAAVVMEHVEGCHFIEYIRPSSAESKTPELGSSAQLDTVDLSETDGHPDLSDTLCESGDQPATSGSYGPVDSVTAPNRVGVPPDLGRLRAALRQLAEAIAAMHAAGKLHRDIKPSNVMVTPEGRVVVLDFGLAARMGSGILDGKRMVGTLAYMSPEQSASTALSFASDWYSFGALLYEALTGHLVFTGSLVRVVHAKQELEPTPPDHVVPGIPSDLAELCMALLSRNPEDRPNASAILGILGGRTTDEQERLESSLVVGRQAQLDELTNAHEQAARRGRAVVVTVMGAPGSGKTTLVRHFAASTDAEFLTGRCFQHESLPYKAFDGVIDRLARRLTKLSVEQLRPYVSEDTAHLCTIFPVLRQAKLLRNNRAVLPIPDRQERRRRAFAALLRLLEALPRTSPLIIFVDDVHWADADSGFVLGALVRGHFPLVLIFGYRAETSSAFLTAAQRTLELTRTPVVSIEVGPLTREDTESLLTSIAGPEKMKCVAFEPIWQDCQGDPLFAVEMAHRIRDSSEHAGVVTLREIMLERIAKLGGDARRMLEVLAVAARPTRLTVLSEVAEVAEVREGLGQLVGLRLVRTSGSRNDDRAEFVHARGHEIADGVLTADRRVQIHRRLFEALSQSDVREPEALIAHLVDSGARDGKLEHAITLEAARAATEALAFVRAATLFERALAHPALSKTERFELQVKLGLSCEHSGRGHSASDAYLAAAELARDDDTAQNLIRRAAEQLLVCGLVDRGLELLRDVLTTVNMGLYLMPEIALGSIVKNQGRLYLRGFNFEARQEADLPREVLRKLDVCWAGVRGLSLVDPIQGLDFHMRYLLLALEAGEERRIALGLASHASHAAFDGKADVSGKALALAVEIAERLDDPYTYGVTALSAAMSGFLLGNFEESHQQSARAQTVLLDSCNNVYWEIANTYLFGLWSLSYLGDIRVSESVLRRAQRTAEESGNLYLTTNLRCTASFYVHVANDDGDSVRRNLANLGETWSKRGYHFQHWEMLLTGANLALYEGRNQDAWDAVSRDWRRLTRSLLMRGVLIRAEAHLLRGRCAVALASTQRHPDRRLLRVVARSERKLRSTPAAWVQPWRLGLRAALAWFEGDRQTAMDILREAIVGLEAQKLWMHAAAARTIVGEFGDPQAAQQGRQWMERESVVRPWRLVRVLFPGPWIP